MAAIPAFCPTTNYARLSTLAYPTITPTTKTTTAAVTYTAAEILSGFILRDPNGAARADLFPPAADIIAAINGCQRYTAFRMVIRNTADAAETITMTTNTGLTLSGTLTIAQNAQKEFLFIVTNELPNQEAITVYNFGSQTF